MPAAVASLPSGATGGSVLDQPGHERHQGRDVGVELLGVHRVAVEEEDTHGADLDDLTRLLPVEAVRKDSQHLDGRPVVCVVVETLADVLVSYFDLKKSRRVER